MLVLISRNPVRSSWPKLCERFQPSIFYFLFICFQEENYEIADDDDDLPFACFLCREPFKHPVVTKCKHYFCEQCALQHYKKSKRCFACGEQTFGVFNTAKDIIAKMKKEEKEKVVEEEGPPDVEEEEEGEGGGGGGVKPAFWDGDG